MVHCAAAVETLTERCAGAVWERVTAQRFLIAALFFSGQFARLSEAVPPLLVEAERTANLYAKQFFRGGYSIASWLIRDEVAEARRQLGKAEDEWRSETYQLPEYNRLLSGTYIDLYDEEAERAAETIQRHWPTIEEAQLLRIAIVRVQMWQLRGAAAVAAAMAATERGDLAKAERFRADARKSAAVLRRAPLRRAKPLGALVDAAADVAAGARSDAEAKLGEAAADFETLGMQLFAAAARLRLGELVGGEAGQALAERSHDQFRKQCVVDPDRMAGMLAPGFPAVLRSQPAPRLPMRAIVGGRDAA